MAAQNLPQDGKHRAIIDNVEPQVDGGRFPVKRAVGEYMVVEADVFADGDDKVCCALRFCEEGGQWHETVMQPLGNDRWRGTFRLLQMGRYSYTITAWIDHFASWRHEMARRTEPDDINVALLVGADLIGAAASRATGQDADGLRKRAEVLRSDDELNARVDLAMSEDLAKIMAKYPDRRFASLFKPELTVMVDPELARFGAWYEIFPRSCKEKAGHHGTFAGCEARLPYIAEMGFDVLYLPPIHPIGTSKRKGANNTLVAAPGDPGSPWAIGSKEGGHLSIHPELGTMEDFRRLVALAHEYRIEVALDIAFQCAPDHPYVNIHPSWFRHRPDGSVQYAENPPKKYEDIYPFDFESDDWQSLWHELDGIFRFWIDQGIRVFRVDNPHTKSFAFWEWVIDGIKRDHPETIFLAEAFTRPVILHYLAKLGFTQSLNYFPWRNTRRELTEYFTELTRGKRREYLRPSLWPNTPDILTEYLQFGGRPAFMIRLTLAATLGASYGIYGPAFELFENRSREPGSEEYLDSEKYQIRDWDINRPGSLKDYIARVNRIRRENAALQHDWNLRFHAVENDDLICYSKNTDDLTNIVLVVVNLNPHHAQGGWVEIPLKDFDLEVDRAYQVHDLLSSARFLWHGPRNYVELDPYTAPAHIFRLRRRVRSERDFDYYL